MKTPEGQPARQQLQQIEYGRPNSDIRTVINTANGMGKNLVVEKVAAARFLPIPLAVLMAAPPSLLGLPYSICCSCCRENAPVKTTENKKRKESG